MRAVGTWIASGVSGPMRSRLAGSPRPEPSYHERRSRSIPLNVKYRGMALNTMEDAKGANAIGFQSARLKLQRFAKRGMQTQMSDRFLQMLSGECIGGVDRANGVMREVNAGDASMQRFS